MLVGVRDGVNGARFPSLFPSEVFVSRDPRYDILFEPVKIGPVTAKNRFFQVPHCTGMGSNWPNAHAALRGQRAEGGWGVVCTEYCSIHASSDREFHPSWRGLNSIRYRPHQLG